MNLDFLEVEQEVNWKLRPRTHKRKCKYLENESQEQLCLPSPMLTAKLEEINNKSTLVKKIRIEQNRSIIQNIRDVISTVKETTSFRISPGAIIGGLHVILNLFVISVFIFCFGYVFSCAIRDIMYKISVKRLEAKTFMEEAKHLYLLNRCDPTTRVPALNLQCDQWEHMANHGFYSIKYTKIVVELFADVLDGFVSKFKIKTLGVIILFMSVYLILRKRAI